MWARVLLAVLVVCGRASAQPANDDVARAEAAMARGMDAASKGDDAGALAAYQEAEALAPSANVPHKLAGEVLEKMGRFAEARLAYRKYLEVSPTGKSAGEITARIERIDREHFGVIVFACTPESATSTLQAAETAVSGGAMWTVAPHETLVSAPQRWALHVEAPGFVTLDKTISVLPGTRQEVDCKLAPVDIKVHEPPPPRHPPPPPPPQQQQPEDRPWYRRPLVLGGVVGATVAVISIGLYVSLAGGPPSSDGGGHSLP